MDRLKKWIRKNLYPNVGASPLRLLSSRAVSLVEADGFYQILLSVFAR
jgi:hypothetical protein